MPKFLCNSNPCDLVESFIDAVEGLATQSTAQIKLKILEVETVTKSKLTRNLESLKERRYRKQRVSEFKDHCFEDNNEEKSASTHFLQMQKKSIDWAPRTSWPLLQRITSVWIEKRKIRHRLDEILFVTHSHQWEERGTQCD